MVKKYALILLFILFALNLNGCYRIESVNKVKTALESQELAGVNEIKDVVLVGKVKQIVSFPTRRYLLSSSNGEDIWVVMDEDKGILPRSNEKVVVIGTASRFFFIGDVCIKERAHYRLSLVIVGVILFFVMLLVAFVIFLVVRRNKSTYNYPKVNWEDDNDL